MRVICIIGSLVGFFSFTCCSGINAVHGTSEGAYTEIGDFFLDLQLEVINIIVEKNSNGNKVVNVQIENKTWGELILEVKMDFFKGNGAPLDNLWGWKPLTLESGQDGWVKFVAPYPNAEKFKLLVKEADSNSY